jgi:phytoene synthase
VAEIKLLALFTPFCQNVRMQSAETLPAPAAVPAPDPYAACTKLAREHYENFPVGRLVPKKIRPHVHAVYAFARVADDLADEGYADPRRRHAASSAPTEAERLAVFRAYRLAWQNALANRPFDTQYQWIFNPLLRTKAEFDLPDSLFLDLLSAFEQDIVQRRYQDFPSVLDYCRRSANPIGRLVLLLHGHREEELAKLSDHICTALQLANFWQDVSVDLGKDRIYIPQLDLHRFDVPETDLFAGKATPNFRNCLRYQVDRAWDLFRMGEPLSSRLKRPLSWEIRLTWLGGTKILQKIESQKYNTLTRRPVVSKFDFLSLGLQAFFGA